MAGISGTPKLGSQSIVLSGGYKDDVDQGDTFIYSGAGGRESKKTGARVPEAQSFDQTLDKTNAALAITMFPGMTDPERLRKEGAISNDWTQSKPVRVIRSDKMRHSDYAPTEGFRYDGIYKLVRYWAEKGRDGFITYKYEFKRDDPNPAPWTAEGKARINELGLTMVCVGGKRKLEDDDLENEKKKKKTSYVLDPKFQRLVDHDIANQQMWRHIFAHHGTSLENIAERVIKEFVCPVCGDLVLKPLTFHCGHSVCGECHDDTKCPKCWEQGEQAARPNQHLAGILRHLNPRHEGESA